MRRSAPRPSWKAGSAGAPTSCARNWWPRRRPVRACPRPAEGRGSASRAGAEAKAARGCDDPGAARPHPSGPAPSASRATAAARCRNAARPARAVEAGRPGRPAQPRAVEALRRSLQRSLQGGGGLAGQGQGRGGGTPGGQRLALIEEVKAWAAAHPDGQGRRLEGLQPRPAPVLGPLARGRPPEREGLRGTAAAVEGGDRPAPPHRWRQRRSRASSGATP